MKAKKFTRPWLAGFAGIFLLAGGVRAQDSTAAAAPHLANGVPQILKLAQAKVGEDTIIAYVHNSGNSYGLDADQIIYLRQQGVSDNVLTAMLNQPKAAASPAQSMTQPNNSYAAQAPADYVQPQPAYVVPNTQAYYYNSYYAQPYYYPYYVSSFPFVSFSFVSGNRFHCVFFHGGGFHSGNFHGGGFHFQSGGFHGGNFHGGGPHFQGGGFQGGGFRGAGSMMHR